ncbi:MAG: HIT domain-containing protein [Candidatus Harrisonbacteria bacterium]|nr:HIT domain-containing protein [Candidatus Harrisonbacteria bacterium]
MNEDKHVNVNHARLDEQRKVMEKIVEDDRCPFCPQYLRQYHKEPIILDGTYWILTNNQWPYEDVKHHFLIILKRHARHIKELSIEEFSELHELIKKACEKFSMPGASFFLRFGETKYTGGSVNHLHAQLLQGDADNPNHKSVKVKLG